MYLITLALFALGVFGIFRLGQWAAANATDQTGNYRELWKQARYQPLALLMAFIIVWLNRWLVQPMDTVTEPGDLSAASTGFDWLGLPTGTSWIETGITFTLIPLIGTTLVVYLQVLRKQEIAWRAFPMAFGLSLIFSFTNSLTEELVFRVLLIEGLAPYLDFAVLALVSGVAFGLPHYFGSPGKVPGVLMAGFLGWVMARSVLDTGGLAWAWLIHFVQDVPIFTMLLLLSASKPRASA